MRQLLGRSIEPVAERSGRPTVVLVVFEDSLTRRGCRFDAVLGCFFVPKHGSLATRVGVSPLKAARCRQLFQS